MEKLFSPKSSQMTIIFFLFYIGVQLINSVLSVSGVWQRDSVIHKYVSIHFQIPFPFKLLHTTEQSSLCYTEGPRSLLVIHLKYGSVFMSTPNSLTIPVRPHPSPMVTISSFSKFMSLFLSYK